MATEAPQTFRWQYNGLDDDNFKIGGRTLLYILLLFSIISLIIFFFFVCAHCLTRFRSRSSPPSSQPQCLDNSLPITIHHLPPTSTDSLECSVCLGVFEEGEKVKVLPSCGHCYHCDCIDKWLTTHSSCPICRTSVPV